MTILQKRPEPATTTPPTTRPPLRRSGNGGLGIVIRYLMLAIVLAVAIQALSITVANEQWWASALVLAATLAVVGTYATRRAVPLKYLIPGILLMLMFQIYPVFYTFYTAFTNASDGHTISKEESIEAITVDGPIVEGQNADRYALSIAVADGADPNTSPFVYLLVGDDGTVFLGDESGIASLPESSVTLNDGKVSEADGFTLLNGVQINDRSSEFDAFSVPLDGDEAVKKIGLSEAFAGTVQYRYDEATDTIVDTVSGTVFVAENASWVPEDGGPTLAPGWKQFVGVDNFAKVLTNDTVRNSFIGILIWNIAFAGLSVLTTFGLGLLLAIVLNRKMIGQRLTRSLLLLPYALPGFITALVWASMYNKDFGLINNLTGLDVNWLGDVWWAKVALLVTNLWLGFPYMFLICTGALQSMPANLTEAAIVDGASPWRVFRSITVPMLMVAIAPMLVASFAFNFNNFTLIFLLTEGGPFPADNPSAGATDLLISYTYRLAFGDGGSQFGFAAAISIFIFIIVAILSISSFKRALSLEEVNS